MKTPRPVLSILLAGVLLSLGGCNTNQLSVAQGKSYGSIKFAEDLDNNGQPTGKTCSIDIPPPGSEPKQVKMADTDCKNDEASAFYLQGVISATVIKLSSESSCNGGDWAFYMRTFIQPTTSRYWYPTFILENVKTNAVILSGLLMSENGYKSGNIAGKLSCVVFYPPGV